MDPGRRDGRARVRLLAAECGQAGSQVVFSPIDGVAVSWTVMLALPPQMLLPSPLGRVS